MKINWDRATKRSIALAIGIAVIALGSFTGAIGIVAFPSNLQFSIGCMVTTAIEFVASVLLLKVAAPIDAIETEESLFDEA